MSTEVRGNSVTLFEHRPVWRMPDNWTDGKTARFRYNPMSERWTLHWNDRRGRWLHYERKRPAADMAALIREVDEDPLGAFRG